MRRVSTHAVVNPGEAEQGGGEQGSAACHPAVYHGAKGAQTGDLLPDHHCTRADSGPGRPQ